MRLIHLAQSKFSKLKKVISKFHLCVMILTLPAPNVVVRSWPWMNGAITAVDLCSLTTPMGDAEVCIVHTCDSPVPQLKPASTASDASARAKFQLNVTTVPRGPGEHVSSQCEALGAVSHPHGRSEWFDHRRVL